MEDLTTPMTDEFRERLKHNHPWYIDPETDERGREDRYHVDVLSSGDPPIRITLDGYETLEEAYQFAQRHNVALAARVALLEADEESSPNA